MIRDRINRGLKIAFCLSVIPISAAAATATTAQRVDNLKNRGSAEIDRRLKSLNEAAVTISASQKLTDTDKTAIANQVKDEISGLTELKAKLAAATTLTTARASVASIVNDYRVYALMLPKVRLVAAADRVDVAMSRLSELAAKLAERITEAEVSGEDVTSLKTSLANVTTRLSDAKAENTGLAAKLLAIQPSDYNADHATLTKYRYGIAVSMASLKSGRDEAKKVVEGLKALN